MKTSVDLFTQAEKALAERHPFDAEESTSAPPRDTSLPALLVSVLARGQDGRRKPKKARDAAVAAAAAAETPHHHPGPGRPPKPPTIWEINEDCFRPVELSDISTLIPKAPPARDSVLCLRSPFSVCNHEEAAEAPASSNQVTESQATYMQRPDSPHKGNITGNDTTTLELEPDSRGGLTQLGVQEHEEIQVEEDDSPSLNWIMGSKQRCVLVSERPNKKRKLLGGDAGLNRLLRLPRPQEESCCHVCFMGTDNAGSNAFISCDSCKVIVHRKCYGVHDTSGKHWLCSWCKHLEESAMISRNTKGKCDGICELCQKGGGALKPFLCGVKGEELKFVHLFCSMWMPELYVEDTETMEPVVISRGFPGIRKRLLCYLCKDKEKNGVCIRCSHGTCRTSFHPSCARDRKHQMEIWGKPGCDNVELRAFCMKHSSIDHKGDVQHYQNLAVNNVTSITQPLSTCLPMNMLLKLKLGGNRQYKISKPCETMGSIRDEITKHETTSEFDVMIPGGNGGGKSKDKDICNGDQELEYQNINGKEFLAAHNLFQNSSEDGTASLSPELEPEMIKCIEDSVHSPVAERNLNIKTSPNSSNASHASCLHALDDTREVELCVSNAPPKDSLKNTKEDETVCASNSVLIENDGSSLLLSEVINGETNDSHGQDQDVRGMIMDDISSAQDLRNLNSQLLIPRGNTDKQEDILSVTENLQPTEGKLSSDTVIEADDPAHGSSEMANLVHPDDRTSMAASDPSLQHAELRHNSLTHQFSKEKLLQLHKYLSCEKQSTEDYRKADCICGTYGHHPSCLKDSGSAMDPVKPGQFNSFGSISNLGLLPEDEIEGEMLYLHNKLLNKTTAIKHICEDLLCKVVHGLPKELDSSKKRRWDLVVVNQFLRELREAKKRGRKERKHKEAQAVLAAAAAVAASSSRNSSVRKETDDTTSHHEEIPAKANMVSGRASLYSPLLPRARETHSRPALVKIPSDKLSGIPCFSKESTLSCDICRRGETPLNRMFVCSSCKVSVHLDCYRRYKDPVSSWKCELCEEMSLQSVLRNDTADCSDVSSIKVQCGLCGGVSGAFRKTAEGKWVHAFCAEWLLESTFRRGQHNVVEGMEEICKDNNLLPCSICQRKFGLFLKCSYGHCQVAFHPSCARSTGLYMNVKNVGGSIQHKAYCANHSLEQKEADIKQHGNEELKSMKQIRVELERLRLLCERVIKREKLKREVVLCSHEFHASRRDCVAFSAIVRSSFFLPGGSSESATTSIDDRSYSGIQRSDDITVDSTVCSNRRVRRPSRKVHDRRTDDSSTSQLSFKRKVDEGASSSGKKIPHRTGSGAFKCTTDDGEKRSKTRKHPETFQKEVVMTSIQASLKNMCLPKGFVYVPIQCVPEEKPDPGDSESPNPSEPGG